MNLHGYKLHKKGMRANLNAERNKPAELRNVEKIQRLEESIKNCSLKICELKKNKGGK